MKKVILSVLLASVVISVSACGSKTTSSNNQNAVNKSATNTSTNAANNIASENKSSNNTNEVDSPKSNINETSTSSSEDSNTITDINSWNHPVKYVFKNAGIQVTKVDFKNNKTYPIFYVKLVKDLNNNYKIYYNNLIKQVATANGYWDYEIIDNAKNVDIKVTCNRGNRTIKQALYNGKSSYFQNSKVNNTESVDNEMINYLKDNVSEVKSFMDVLSKSQSPKGIIYVEREPDSNSNDIYVKNYYLLYVGESYTDHNVNIYRFAINKDTKEILYYDVTDNKYESLSDWRKNK